MRTFRCMKLVISMLTLVVFASCGGRTADQSNSVQEDVNADNGSISRPVSLSCTSGQSIYACKSNWSDGSSKSIDFPNSGASHSGEVSVDQAETQDNYGNTYCVSLYSDGQGSFSGGTCVGGGNSQVPVQTNRYVTNTACSVTMTYYDEYENPSRYTLQITTYYSDGTQSSIGRDSTVPC